LRYCLLLFVLLLIPNFANAQSDAWWQICCAESSRGAASTTGLQAALLINDNNWNYETVIDYALEVENWGDTGWSQYVDLITAYSNYNGTAQSKLEGGTWYEIQADGMLQQAYDAYNRGSDEDLIYASTQADMARRYYDIALGKYAESCTASNQAYAKLSAALDLVLWLMGCGGGA
jgi:hypothetical protein